MKKSKSKLKFKPEDTIKSLFFENPGKYPTQLMGDPVADKGGEYRTYYPNGGGVWKPRSSHRGGRSHGSHNGSDIYTGYGAFPVETPILASTDGYFQPIFDAVSPNMAGNRAAISTHIGTDKIDFRYGHLSRFARDAGNVVKGEVIGYAGCSGNADTVGECTEEGTCGLTSCHVHLITALNENYNSPPDPIAMLGWDIKYGPGEDELRKCKDIVGQAKTFVPERLSGSLKAEKRLNHKRLKGKRHPLPEPFKQIKFDSTRRLNDSLASYENLTERMQSLITSHSKDGNSFGDDLTDFMRQAWLGQLKQARNKPKTAHGRALKVLDTETKLLSGNQDELGLGGPITRSLLAAAKALWLLTGGAAIQSGMSNRTLVDLWGTSGRTSFSGKQRRGVRSKNPLNTYAKIQSSGAAMAPPACGLGVNGWAALVASDHAQCAHHVSWLDVKADIGEKPVKGSAMAISLDFGVVAGMQSIWPINIGDFVEDADIVNAPVKKFCDQVSRCLMRYMSAYDLAFLLSAGLSLKDKNDSRRKTSAGAVANELEDLHKDIEQTFDSFLNLNGLTDAKAEQRKQEIESLLSLLVKFNKALVKAARDRSRETESRVPIGPRLVLLSLDIDAGGANG